LMRSAETTPTATAGIQQKAASSQQQHPTASSRQPSRKATQRDNDELVLIRIAQSH